jgi:hypothetical protein
VLRVSRIIRATLLDDQFSRVPVFNLAQYWTDYCAQLETNHPPYAVPLRLAPDDAASLPQLLSEWGYILIESDDLVEPEVQPQVVPFQQYHQKNSVLSLDNGAQWRRPQQKKRRLSVQARPQQKKDPGFVQARPQQKKGHTPPRPQQKKAIPRVPNKKNTISVLKKTGDWLVVDGGKAVAQSRNERKKAPSQQKKNAGFTVQRKKTDLKKVLSSANKKKQFSRPIKKSNTYFSPVASLAQSA